MESEASTNAGISLVRRFFVSLDCKEKTTKEWKTLEKQDRSAPFCWLAFFVCASMREVSGSFTVCGLNAASVRMV